MRYFIPFIVWCCISTTFGCKSTKSISLEKTNIELVNRSYSSIEQPNIISIEPAGGGGIAIIKSVEFEIGTIEFDVRGENNPGKSFVGLAFNIQDEDTYEAIYFRPFNFESEEKIRRSHSIQYVFHPEYTWRKLREEQEGVFEAKYNTPPDPDDWFSVKLEISKTTVIVRDPKSGNIILKVSRLGEFKSRKIGFWTGNNSKGDFRNLKVTNK